MNKEEKKRDHLQNLVTKTKCELKKANKTKEVLKDKVIKKEKKI